MNLVKKIKLIGTFQVANIQDEFVELEPVSGGNVEFNAKFTKSSIGELNADGSAKEFDGFSVGDFFKFNGEYEYVRQNEIFVKAMVEGQMVSVPLHKVQEVK